MKNKPLSSIYNYKEIIAFCFFFSISFVFMAKVVKNVNPVVSTFFTYSIAAIFFSIINLKHFYKILKVIKQYKYLVFKINVSTLVNTLLAFYIVLFISPISYIIVFFSGLSFFNAILTKNIINKTELFFNFLTIILALNISFLISNAELYNTLMGLILTLISTLFAAFYMQDSALLHIKSKITVSQILSIRFILVIIVCGFYSFLEINNQIITAKDFGLLSLIAITGTIIPLFLIQKSIKTIGPQKTSKLTPLTSVLCLIFMKLIGAQTFSIVEVTLTILVTFTMMYQAILNYHNHKEKIDE